MASTASGWQYPQAADPLASYPPVAQAVAEKLEGALGAARVASGTAALSITTGEGTVAVTFPVGRFTAAPRVSATANSRYYNLGVAGISASGCTIAGRDVRDTGASTTSLATYWTAVQES